MPLEEFPVAWRGALDEQEPVFSATTLPKLFKSLFAPSAPPPATEQRDETRSTTRERQQSQQQHSQTTHSLSPSIRNVASPDQQSRRQSGPSQRSRSSSGQREAPKKESSTNYRRPIRLSTIGPNITRDLVASTSSTNVNIGRQMPTFNNYPEAYSPGSVSSFTEQLPHSHSFYPVSHNFTTIPGFPLSTDIINDDAMSVSSMGTHNFRHNDLAASQVFRRLRGDGLSREYWMPDEMSKQCRDCGSVFTALRRKHHCRVCGQIFCSTCASNIISGTRFGHKGFVRTCNDCLAKMDNEMLHPRRGSVEEAPISHAPARTTSLRQTISVPLESQYKGPQSQFAASVLFPRSEFPRGGDSDDEDDLQSRPETPVDVFDADVDGLASPVHLVSRTEEAQHAPFRKHAEDEDAAIVPIATPDAPNSTEEPPSGETLFPAEAAMPLLAEAEQAVASSPVIKEAESPTSARPMTPSSSVSYLMARRYEGRSRRSSVDDLSRPESASLRRALLQNERPRKDSLSGIDQDLASVNFSFIRALLKQCLRNDGIQDTNAWEAHLMVALARLTRSVRHDHRLSDEIDIRKFIKIKRLPGGKPGDTNYIDGVAFTKNIAHKGMARARNNPRIMLFSYPIEYQHSAQFMSLDPLITQERDYLEKLVRRIASFRPHLVLVEHGVSQIALKFFLDHKIIVIKHVKASVMHAVSRSTGSDIISSMDQLLTQPAIGRCGRVRIETFDHSLIPGRRKTIVRAEGCAAELGATIVLRGADNDTLTRIKKTMRFMILVANSLRMESFLFYDEHIHVMKLPKSTFELPEDIQARLASIKPTSEENARVSETIAAAIRPFTSAILSSSPFATFPPPHPTYQIQIDDLYLNELRQARADEEVALIIKEENESALSRRPSASIAEFKDDPSETASESGFSVRYNERASQLYRSGSYLQAAVSATAPNTNTIAVQLEEAEDRHIDRLAVRLFLCTTKCALTCQMFELYRLRHNNSLDPRQHQKVMVLCSVVNSATLKTCVNPELRLMHYYGEGDQTLGNFIEAYVAEASRFCPLPTCAQACLLHYKIFVHGSRRVTAILEQFPCPVPGGQDRIYLWSYCKICESPAKHTVMSDQTWSYSFAHYLELSFYAGELGCKTISPNCMHNVHKDHVRYFSYKNLAVRIYSDDVETFDVFQPPLKLKQRKALAVQLREEEYKSIAAKHEIYWQSVAHRLQSFNFESVHADKVEAAKAAIEEYSRRLESDRKTISALLLEKHKDQGYSGGIVLNAARRAMQDKVVDWDSEFSNFEAKFAASDRDRDLRRLTGYQLKRLFTDTSNPGSPEHKGTPGFSTPPSEDGEKSELDETASAVSDVSIMGLPALGLEGPIAELSAANLAKMETAIEMPDQPLSAASQSGSFIDHGPLSLESPSTSKPASTADNDGDSADSDSTICAEPAVPLVPFEFNDTSQSEAEGIKRAATPKRKAVPVADLVKRFDATEEVQPNENSRPLLRRGKSDTSRLNLQRQRSNARLPGGVLSGPEEGGMPERSLQRKSRVKLATPKKAENPQSETTKEAISTSKGTELIPTSPRPPNITRRSTIKPSKIPSRLHLHNKDITLIQHAQKSLSTGPQPIKATPSIQLQGRLAAQRRVASASHTGSRVSTIARHFDRLSREAERDRQRRMAVMRGRRARPVASAKPTIEVYTSAKEALREDSDNESGHGSAGSADDEFEEADELPTARGKQQAASDQLSRQPSIAESYIYDEPASLLPESQQQEATMDDNVVNESPDISAPVSPTVASTKSGFLRPSQLSESEMSSSGTDKNSLMRTITSLWAFRGCDFTPLQYPLSASEHVFTNNPVIVREDEPSSIIAFALASRAYKDKLKEAEHGPRVHEAEAFMPTEDNVHGHDRASNWGMIDVPDIPDLEEQLKRPQVQHFRLQFEEGSGKFSCKVFFAEQFDALRHKCGCEESFIDSLARCVKWDASGGKSGSAFLKTRDDRFIIKEISRLEMDAFLRFAPAYFDYMTRAFFHTLPTLLAKVLGFFRLSFTSNGKVTRMDVLVMENLFYDRTLTKIYDLKGSKRNRHVVTTGKRGEVLLDENLTEMAYKSPLFVTEQSKKLLRMSLFNDTLFLEKLNVMDYSLVVGVDSVRGELVVGIVDFIRTYTWDKKVENWVKGTGRVEPTVVTPKLYKTRLRNATEDYFLLCPDKWTSPESMLRPKEATLADAQDQQQSASQSAKK